MPAVLVIVAMATVGAAALQDRLPAGHPPVSTHTTAAVMYVPERVFDTRRRTYTDFEAMLADLARADVIVVGEQHDDPNTHRLESAILQGLLRRRVRAIVSLEMFERDVQPVLDAYLGGKITEQEFLARSRPWPRYATDYRPLVEMARAHKWPVIAANVPRRLAGDVSKRGMAALEALDGSERAHAARDLQCPADRYFERFLAAISAHPPPGTEDTSEAERRQAHERMYQSQCLKDETMAESIAAAVDAQAGGATTVVHFTGAFHSDFGAGTVERIRRRLPARRVVTVSMMAKEDLDSLSVTDEDLTRAEYLVYTVK